MTAISNLIKLDRDFFKRERQQVYDHWQEAYWRELIQNSVDANARRINIVLGTYPTVSLHDDGTGMTLDVLERVYMTLGRTTKGEDSDGVGGFGRARILTCFSHPNWELKSMGWHCVPAHDGMGYVVQPDPHYKDEPGMMVRTTIDPKDDNGYWDLDGKLKRAWKNYLKTCHLPNIEFFIDGEPWKEDWKVAQEDEFLVDILDARLFHDPKGKGDLIVRVNGLTMFKQHYGLNGPHKGYILELNPKTSRKYLNGSRDSLHDKMREETDKLLRAAVRGEYDRFMKPIPKLLRITQREVYRVTEPTAAPARSRYRARNFENRSLPNEFFTGKGRKVARSRSGLLPMAAKERAEFLENEAAEGRIWTALDVYFDGADVAFDVDTNNPQLREAALAWDPTIWKGSLVDGFVFWSKKEERKAKLLRAFTSAVDLYASIYHGVTSQQYSYVTGFRITGSELGSVSNIIRPDKATLCFVALNPLGVDKDGKVFELYTSLDRDTLLDIGSTAAHEVVHLQHGYHGEPHSNDLTELMSLVETDVLIHRMKDGL